MKYLNRQIYWMKSSYKCYSNIILDDLYSLFISLYRIITTILSLTLNITLIIISLIFNLLFAWFIKTHEEKDKLK